MSDAAFRSTAAIPPAVWIGRGLSGLVVLFLLADAATELFAPAKIAKEMAETGWAASLAFPLGLITLTCALLYAVPRTAMLGAILVTAFLGGAVATHVRIGDFTTPPLLICIVVGIFAWLGLYLRDAQLRALLPLRR